MEPRIYGPYKHRHRWRIFVYDAEGRRSARVQLDAAVLAGPVLRVGTVLERYTAFMRYKGNQPESIATTSYRPRAFFAEVLWEPLRRIDRARCPRLYDRQVAPLGQAKTFFAWCVRHRYLSLNPVERIRPVGRREHGEPQLRVDEARAWMRVARMSAGGGQPGAIAAMVALVMGMRCSEIVRYVARDVDDGGRLLMESLLPECKRANDLAHLPGSSCVAPQ
jgi:hypothetical protein